MASSSGRPSSDRRAEERRARWESMTLTYVGHAGEILEGGGGKPSPFPADPGETFKPSGSAVGGERINP